MDIALPEEPPLGPFSSLPLELIYNILDTLLQQLLRARKRKTTKALSSFFCTCKHANSLMSDWVRHAFRQLGGLPELEFVIPPHAMLNSFHTLVIGTTSWESFGINPKAGKWPGLPPRPTYVPYTPAFYFIIEHQLHAAAKLVLEQCDFDLMEILKYHGLISLFPLDLLSEKIKEDLSFCRELFGCPGVTSIVSALCSKYGELCLPWVLGCVPNKFFGNNLEAALKAFKCDVNSWRLPCLVDVVSDVAFSLVVKHAVHLLFLPDNPGDEHCSRFLRCNMAKAMALNIKIPLLPTEPPFGMYDLFKDIWVPTDDEDENEYMQVRLCKRLIKNGGKVSGKFLFFNCQKDASIALACLPYVVFSDQLSWSMLNYLDEFTGDVQEFIMELGGRGLLTVY
jgi:hypothetical protein